MTPRQHRLLALSAGWLAASAVAIAGFAGEWNTAAVLALCFLAGFLATVAFAP